MNKIKIKNFDKLQLGERLNKLIQLFRQFAERIRNRQAEKSPPPNSKTQNKKNRLTVRSLLVVICCILFIITITTIILVNFFPVYQIHSSAMSPTLIAGDTVICKKGNDYGVGDIVAVKHQDLILIKRIIAEGGDRIIINERGELYINDLLVDEPYASAVESSKIYITQVPQEKWYILNDNRLMQGDSRLNEIGSVSDEEIIGRVIYTVWPAERFGTIESQYKAEIN